MKLLSVGLARAMWFVDIGELNPSGKDVFVHLFPALLEEYKFKRYPKPGDDLSQGMKFSGGEFVKKDGTVLTVSITLFNDAIAADTYSSTTDSDNFLGVILGGLPDLGFSYDRAMVRRKAYTSQLNVVSSNPLSAINPKLIDLAKRIASGVGGVSLFEFSAIEFWPDQTKTYKPASFSFQKRTGDAPSDNRYWSQAPLPTDKHLELLDELEAILS
ncbi:MAG: hypothetical protein ABSH09_21080 [Bryobacteraceae bacterium]|jgi:hypothetical protein